MFLVIPASSARVQANRMPPPKKLDLIPEELRKRLADELSQRGFSDIVEVTEQLNFWLEDAGLEISIGKSAVGDFSKLLKDQRDCFNMAETLLAGMDIEGESDMHKALMQMIAASAMQMMRSVREEDGHLAAKDLMALGRMLKDLMGSAGIREKLREDERARIQREEREAAAQVVEATASSGGMSAEVAERIKAEILGVNA